MQKENRIPGMPSDAQALRDELLRRADVGELSGDEADAEAERLGIGRLSQAPDPSQFDPLKERYWTLPMALAWIVYRSLSAVREWSNPYREACLDWHWHRGRSGIEGPVEEGWQLTQRSQANLDLLYIAVAYHKSIEGRSVFLSVAEARNALWSALRSGAIEASGIETTTGRRVPIAALTWHDLESVKGQDMTDEVHGGGSSFRDVLFPSEAVCRTWSQYEAIHMDLPEVVAPDGFGYMPLYCAAQWIATEGGKVVFDPGDVEKWRPAYRELLSAISSGRVPVVGMRNGQTEPIQPFMFAGIRVDYPFADSPIGISISNALFLRSYPYVDDEHWFAGFDDSLVNGTSERFSRIMVERPHVRGLWPFGWVGGSESGMAGRPALSKHLIEDELHRRAAAGHLLPRLSEEAAALLAWLKTTHPDQARPTAKTVENNIRSLYRTLRAPTKS